MYKTRNAYGFEYEVAMVKRSAGEELKKKFEGKRLDEYVIFDCENQPVIVAFLLNDGRVVRELGKVVTELFKNLQGFLFTYYDTEINRKRIPKQFPINRIAYLPNDEKIYYQHISKVRGDMIKGFELTLDKKKYPNFRNEDSFFLTPDKQVLHDNSLGQLHGSPFYLYQNISDLDKLHDLYSLNRKPVDNTKSVVRNDDHAYMCGRNPYGQDFPKQVDQLIKDLPDALRASSEYKENFLKGNYTYSKIYQLVYAQIISDDFVDKLFLPLYAFLGKYLIKSKGYKWVIEYDNYSDTWVPDLEGENGPIAFYKKLLKILDTTEEKSDPLFLILQQ